jgi:hypothetical protein
LSRYRAFYGARPLHLLMMLAGFAVLGYVVTTITPRALWNPHVWWQSIAVWFAVAIIAHDLVLFPLYALADRLLAIPAERRNQPRVPAINYIRLPLLGSALTFLVFLPGIIEQGAPTYQAATGQTQEPFLGRWLLLTAAMFGVSAVVYAIRVALIRRRRVTDRGRESTE